MGSQDDIMNGWFKSYLDYLMKGKNIDGFS